MFGLGLLLWGIIEAPGRGWTSTPIMAALLAAGVVIASFVIWELHVDHPMLPLRFFTNRRYSAAIAALALVLFALVGVFFLMTQYLQFALSYSPLEAGLRIAPVAVVLLVVAPLSMVLARRVGSKAVVSSGMILIAIGLGILSTTTVHGTYRDCVIPFILLGTGVALALAPCTESVMGSLPIEEAGVGSATNDVSMQVGAALGVGVLGTVLNLRYQHLMAPSVSSSRVPANVRKVIEGSLGGGCPPGIHLWHGPRTHHLRHRGRRSCHRRAGAASQQGDRPDQSGVARHSSSSDKFGQLDTWAMDPRSTRPAHNVGPAPGSDSLARRDNRRDLGDLSASTPERPGRWPR
jgi:hypothetical protein